MTILTRVKSGTLARQWRRLVQLRRAHGCARIGYAILRRALATLALRPLVHTCAVDLWQRTIEGGAQVPGTNLFSVRTARREDHEPLADYFGDHRRVMQRLAQGDQCVVAISGPSIGAAAWLVAGPGHFSEDWSDLGCSFAIPPCMAWTYDGKGTRMGAWGTLMKQLPDLLREQGVREIATIIDCDNWASLDAHRSLGYLRRGTLLHVRVLGCSLRLYKPTGQRWRPCPHRIGPLEISRHRSP